MLGAAVATAVLSGALMVGDSVDATLKRFARERLGRVDAAIQSVHRYFKWDLADRYGKSAEVSAVPVLSLRGSVSTTDGTRRANQVQVNGVDAAFWGMVASSDSGAKEGVWINERMATQLGVGAGDEIVLRVENPSLLPLDAPLANDEDATSALRLVVAGIASGRELGNFSLQANQVPPYNLFVPHALLEEQFDLKDRANLLLLSRGQDPGHAQGVLKATWSLADAGMKVVPVSGKSEVELRTDRIFLDAAAESAMLDAPGKNRVLTYFVNEIGFGDRATPYSVVSGLETIPAGPVLGASDAAIEPPLGDDEILLNAWCAEDLGAQAGDEVVVKYYVLGPMRALNEQSRAFRVRAVVPIEGVWNDPTLMPDFPGVAGQENCRDWEPGFDIDLSRIRNKDEEYWDAYQGAPKAFVTLAAAQSMWTNRFGDLTSIRFPLKQGESFESASQRISTDLLARIEPYSVGFNYLPVARMAGDSASQAMDFGPLFIGFSLFLIVAALLLEGLLNVFGIEQRAEETGTLLALGYPAKVVRRLFLTEGLILAVIGGAVGVILGMGYTNAVLWGLKTIWNDALGGGAVKFHLSPVTLIIGFFSGILMSLFAIWLTVRRQARKPARVLLAMGGDLETASTAASTKTHSLFWVLILLCLGGSVYLLAASLMNSDRPNVAAFFTSGFGMLAGLLLLLYVNLSPRAMSQQAGVNQTTLTYGNLKRRRGRSTATVALLACGSFLVIAVGANRLDASRETDNPQSGTGGFELFAESTFPILHNLNTEEGLNRYGLAKEDLGETVVYPFRVHRGEDASCRNLNRAQAPTLFGFDPAPLADRNSFTFAATLHDQEAGWRILDSTTARDVIPGVVDRTTLQWALRMKLGDEIEYQAEDGKPFRVKLVASLSHTMLQGALIIAEKDFIARFPSASGYGGLLIDAPDGHADEVSALLTQSLADQGTEVIPTQRRLAELNAVENAYLSIFQALGGLGLILGCAGLGVLVLRNVLERRGEMALMRTMGFSQSRLRSFVLKEHLLLFALGLGIGAAAGLASVLPHLLEPGEQFPWLSLSLTLAAIAVSGIGWTWAASRLALRGEILSALRNE